MEKKDRPYSVLAYDEEWVKRFEAERAVLSRVFGQRALSIEHIGSTSVPGMWAKPQIDIQITVNDLKDVDELIPFVETEGYAYHGKDSELFGEKYFIKDAESGERLVSVHVRQASSPQALTAIIFRDYLRSHPEKRELYSKTKRDVYESGADRVEYPKRKKEVLLEMIKRAEEWDLAN